MLTLWHGTDREFPKFDMAYAGTAEGHGKGVGITFSTSFDRAVRAICAVAWAKKRDGNVPPEGQQAVLYRVDVDVKKVVILEPKRLDEHTGLSLNQIRNLCRELQGVGFVECEEENVDISECWPALQRVSANEATCASLYDKLKEAIKEQVAKFNLPLHLDPYAAAGKTYEGTTRLGRFASQILAANGVHAVSGSSSDGTTYCFFSDLPLNRVNPVMRYNFTALEDLDCRYIAPNTARECLAHHNIVIP